MPEPKPIVYYQPIQKFVRVQGAEYVFVVKRNISLAYIEPENVQAILDQRGGCCGQSKKGIFREATEQEVRLWKGEADR